MSQQELIDLWTPEGSSHDSNIPYLGMNVATADRVVLHVFHFYDKVTGRRSKCSIPADSSMSQAQIEDLAARALERWIRDVREQAQKKVGKHAPNLQERLELGRIMREFREHARKRRESTNNLLYYPVRK